MWAAISFGQKGPGGVSDDSDDQTNCRLWLDAGDLTDLGDGDSVIVWYDKSVSATRDSAFRDPVLSHKYTYPVYRNSPSASINGKPVVSFESGGMLGIGKWPAGSISEDLNSNPTLVTTYQQTMFFAFRTSNDVDSRQVIWEEGGGERGINTYIYDGYVYIGAYDFNAGDHDYNYGTVGKVPRFGYVYKKKLVQPNTTYVLAFKYDVPTNNDLTATGLSGTLNGQDFTGSLLQGTGSGYDCSSCPTEVGGIFTHQDPVGIGGVNQGSYNESGQIYGGNSSDPELNFIRRNSTTGMDLFTGRIAEIAYYAYALNDAERIIVENYLAAKYFANVIANDKFIYESSYGDGVIGIGRQQLSPVEHNVSQGDNLFEISATNMGTAFNTAPQYLLVGHNNASISWTTQNTPDSASIQRLRRIWRWNQTGGTLGQPKSIAIKLNPTDIDKLPPLPAGYTKYGLIIGSETQSLPNFSAEYSQVIELSETSGTYSANVPIKDGAYLTICAIKPVVQFRLSTDFAIEGNIGTDAKTAILDLNYIPAIGTTFDVGFGFTPGTATLNSDYQWTPGDSPVTFSANQTSKTISFDIVNDANTVNDLPVEAFTINITSVNNELNIGPRSTLTYSIYDNDPPPKVTFEEATVNINENAGTVNIPLKVIGDLTNSATTTVEYVSGWGSATVNTDFSVTSPQVLHFNSTTLTDNFLLTIKEDLADEYDEKLKLRIISTTGDLGFTDTLNIEIQVNINDNDPEPVVSFVQSNSEGYESISEPQIIVKLSARSAKEITVPFTRTAGTATNTVDYDAAADGVMIFEPGDSTQVLYQDNITSENHITVYGNDDSPEPDETIIFQLNNSPELTNATLGAIDDHTYTIRDYTEYEWQGVAGVGKLNDNTIWMVPDAATDGSDIPNLSPRPIQIIQNNSNYTPLLTTQASGLNNKKMIQFDGINDYLIPGNPSAEEEGQSSLIQTAAFYDSKSIFFVFIPEKVNSSTPQCIFEAGAQRTGMSIYIINNTLYFQAWGWQDNLNPHVEWGLNPSNQTGLAVVSYTGLIAGTPYIISCHHENNTSATATIAGLSIFVNGELVDTYNGPTDRFQSSAGSAGLGAVLWQSRFFNTKYFTNTSGQNNVPSKNKGESSNYFKGKIGDLLYYNEPKMNFARVRIITNYLSARYNIALDPAAQVFDLDYADNLTSTFSDFNKGVAGIGQISGQIHGDSKGESELRIRNASFNASTAFLMWGDNGESLTNTWPVSSQSLPSGVIERSAKAWHFSSNPITGIEHADFYIRYSTAQNAPAFSADPSLLKLLVSSDPDDFSGASVYPVTTILSGHIAEFDGIPVSNGMFVSLGNSSAIYPLPIELLSFTAKLVGKTVDLNWVTASERNNDYFIVERAGEDLIWKEILRKPGAGNSNLTLYYHDKDRYPLSGISYYRLKQVDDDGQYKYSDVVSVLNSTSSTSEDIYLFPNPSRSGMVYLRLPAAFSKTDAKVSIYNVSGIKVRETVLNEGAALRELNYGNLSPGVYFVNVCLPFLNETKKFVIQ